MKLISLLENFGKYIAVSSILMYLLNHKNWDNIWKGVPGDPERLASYFILYVNIF